MPSEPNATSIRILVLEHDSALRSALVDFLRLEGHAVTEGDADGERALREGTFDVVILDTRLGDGELPRWIELSNGASWVLLSTDATEGLRDHALGVTTLVKPFDLDALVAVVDLSARRARDLRRSPQA